MGVVGMAAGVVADGSADFVGEGVEALQKFFQGFLLEVGVGSEGLVEVVDISGVMLAVVEGHGLGVDVGLKGGGGVGERRKGEGAGWPSSARARQALLSYGGFRCNSGRREQTGGEGSSEEGLEKGAAGHSSIFRFSRWRGKLFVYV
jgi:hypothetical protein